MTTRTYCDNCGHTIRNSNVFCYGPHSLQRVETPQQHIVSGIPYGGIPSPVQGGVFTPSKIIPLTTLDLCDRCVPIWMERVKKLTAASEPDDVQSS